MSTGTVFSTRPDRSRSIPAWAHFSPRVTRQNAERSWWSGRLKCSTLLQIEKFNTHSEFNSSLIFTWPTQTCAMRETYELFSREVMQTGRTDPQEIRKFRSTFWVYPLWWNFRNYRKLCVPFARDVGFSLPTERELTWTLEKAIMVYDMVPFFSQSKGTAVFVFLTIMRNFRKFWSKGTEPFNRLA